MIGSDFYFFLVKNNDNNFVFVFACCGVKRKRKVL